MMHSRCWWHLGILAVLLLVGATGARGDTIAELSSKASALQADKKTAEALAAWQAALAAATTDADKWRPLTGMSQCCRLLGRPTDARKYSMQALDLCPPTAEPSSVLGAIRDVFECSVKDDELREAIPFLEKTALRDLFPASPGQGREQQPLIRFFLAQMNLRLGQTDKGVELLRAVVDDTNAPRYSRGDAWAALAGQLLKQEKYGEAIEGIGAARMLGVQTSNGAEMAAIEAQAVKGIVEKVECDRAGAMLRDLRLRFLAMRDSADATRDSVYAMQAALVDVLMAARRYPDACREAKVLMDICGSRNLQNAVAKTSLVLKAADGNLVRANAFLEYQKFLRPGPDGKLGTNDDLANPLAQVELPPDPARDQGFQKTIVACPKSWDGAVTRARVFRCWDRLPDALRELKQAFALAPMEALPLQQVTDDTVEVLLLLTGDPDAGRRFVDFQKFGSAGTDRKPGTSDDLKDPVDECLASTQSAPIAEKK